jgi:hypothetical protein
VALVSGDDPAAARARRGPFSDDRDADASHTLAALTSG